MSQSIRVHTRRIFHHGVSWRTWAAFVVVPLLVMGLFTWSYWDPQASGDAAQAAVINNDEPVTVDGQQIPLGRELAGELTHSDDSPYEWVLTDEDDAAEGLASGEYAAVVTIPEDFSKSATSGMTQDASKAKDATQGTVDITTTSSAGIADPSLAAAVAGGVQNALDTQVIDTYLQNIYVSFSTMHDQLADAADGAGQLADATEQLVVGASALADGTVQLHDGAVTLSDGAGRLADATGQLADGAGTLSDSASQLADGAGQLADGTGQLVDGAGQLSDGASQLADGTETLDDGAGQLADGAGTLSDGLSQLNDQTSQLPDKTAQLAQGADQVADGNEELAATVVPIANDAIGIIDQLPDAHDSADRVAELATQCDTGNTDGSLDDLCASLHTAADDAADNADDINDGVSDVRGKVEDARDNVSDLAEGARQVADGNDELAEQAVTLADAVSTASDGAGELSDNAATLADGTDTLATNARTLADGASDAADSAGQLDDAANTLADGSSQLADGAADAADAIGQVDDGAQTLADGSSQLADKSSDLETGASDMSSAAGQIHDGTTTLDDGLNTAVDQVPDYSSDDSTRLAGVLSDPTDSDLIRTPFGTLSITLFAALALWVLALVTYIVTSPLPHGIRLSSDPTWLITVRTAVPGAIAAVSAAGVISLVAIPVLGLGVGKALGFTAVALLGALAFVGLNQALAAVLGTAGRVASGAVAVLLLATGVISAIPSPLLAARSFLPTQPVIVALRDVITGSPGLGGQVLAIVAWMVAALVATVLVTNYTRNLSPRQLRRGSNLTAHPGPVQE